MNLSSLLDFIDLLFHIKNKSIVFNLQYPKKWNAPIPIPSIRLLNKF